MWAPAALAVLVTLAPGPATAPVRPDRSEIPVDELLAGRILGLGRDGAALVDEKEVLAVTPEMRAFLDEEVATGAVGIFKLRQLGNAIIHAPTFRLEYDETTRTAAATFQARRGNCLSFSNMFVALARQLGLKASFQEVDTPPDWAFRNDAFVLNRHVNVLVDLGSDGEHVVDFNMDDFRTTYDRRKISDARALAHYYNNVAVERMQAADTAAALGYLRKAVANCRK